MRFLQPPLSSAVSRASYHVSFNPCRSSRMVSGQFFLGLSLPLFRPRSPVHHLFGFSIHVHSGHMTQPRQSFPSDDAAQLLLSCSLSDCLVWYFIPPCDMQYPPLPSVMRRLQSPVFCYCDWPCLGSVW